MPDDLDSGGLFEVEPVQRVDTHSAAAKSLVDRTFRRFDPDQGLLFRKRHLSALGHLFVQALALCQATKRKAMSYARMSDKEKVPAEEVSALLLEAERIDKAEDKRFGKNRRGDEIRQAEAALEEEAAQAARAKAEAGPRTRR